jgi:hypothetical protein
MIATHAKLPPIMNVTANIFVKKGKKLFQQHSVVW